MVNQSIDITFENGANKSSLLVMWLLSINDTIAYDTNCDIELCVKYCKSPFIIRPSVAIVFVTLSKCDLNVYSHIPYKPLQDYLSKIVITGKKNFTKQFFNARIEVSILFFSYMVYLKFYNS
jgi:hypothetical protein